MRLALLALAISVFAIGATEFAIVDLLSDVAADLGVSIPSADEIAAFSSATRSVPGAAGLPSPVRWTHDPVVVFVLADVSVWRVDGPFGTWLAGVNRWFEG